MLLNLPVLGDCFANKGDIMKTETGFVFARGDS
jgi:hypothetical protein